MEEHKEIPYRQDQHLALSKAQILDVWKWVQTARRSPSLLGTEVSAWSQEVLIKLEWSLNGFPPPDIDKNLGWLNRQTKQLSLWCDLAGIDPLPLEQAYLAVARIWEPGYTPNRDDVIMVVRRAQMMADRIYALAITQYLDQHGGEPVNEQEMDAVEERLSQNPDRDKWVVEEHRKLRTLLAISKASQNEEHAAKGWPPLTTKAGVRQVLVRCGEIKPPQKKKTTRTHTFQKRNKPRAK